MIFYAFDLSNIGTIILFVLIICFLIAWHELGHLLTAKKCNVYCYEYSIGFGPVLYKNKKHETHFCLRAIPLGGFVKMAGEEGLEEGEILVDNNENPIPSNRVLSNQPLHKKALVLAAGGLMNMILAIICFYFYVGFNKPYINSDVTGFITMDNTNTVLISSSDENPSPLYVNGMESGDKITFIKTKLDSENTYQEFEISKFSHIQEALNSKIPSKENQVQELVITFTDVSENDMEKTISVSRKAYYPVNEEGKESVNLSLTVIGLSQNHHFHEYNALSAIWGTWHFMGYYTTEIVKAFGRLFTGDLSGMSGLVGIYDTIDQVATDDSVSSGTTILRMVYITGAISFSLGFFNLIPFPALDGGRLVFVAYEAIFKKKVNPKVEGTIHSIGIFLLFALMIIVNIRDILNLF